MWSAPMAPAPTTATRILDFLLMYFMDWVRMEWEVEPLPQWAPLAIFFDADFSAAAPQR
jgi:hypothetical protein